MKKKILLSFVALFLLFEPYRQAHAENIICKIQSSSTVDRCVQTGADCPAGRVPEKSCSDYRLGEGCPASIPCIQHTLGNISCRVQISAAGIDRCVSTGGGCPGGQTSSKSCGDFIPDRGDACPSSIPCKYITTSTGQGPNNVCAYAGNDTKKNECNRCMDNSGAWTAIGCIQTQPSEFIKKLLQFGIGIGGGIAFLLILFGGFQMMTSAGNPEKLNEGKELVSSAIAGLLMIVFSIFLLRLIGFSILGIPGFK